MKRCVICKEGQLKAGTAVFTVDREEALVVIRNVPALVCDTCEEEYFEEVVTEELLKEVEEVVKARGQFVVRDYQAA